MPEYLFRLEPGEQPPPLTPAAIENALKAHGLVPRHAVRVDGGWWVQAEAPSAEALRAPGFPAGWRLSEARPVQEQRSWADAAESRAMGDVFAFVLLTWPAVIALFEIPAAGWRWALLIAAAAWLVVMHLVAYGGGRGGFFGNTLLMLSGCMAAFWWTHPGPWMYLWIAVILVGLYAGVRGVLKGAAPAAPVPPKQARESG